MRDSLVPRAPFVAVLKEGFEYPKVYTFNMKLEQVLKLSTASISFLMLKSDHSF